MEESTKEEEFNYTSIFRPGLLNRGQQHPRVIVNLIRKFSELTIARDKWTSDIIQWTMVVVHTVPWNPQDLN